MTNCVVECRMLLKDIGGAEYVVVSDIVLYGEGILFSHIQGQGTTKELKMSNIIATGFAQAGWLENGENITLDNIRVIRKLGAGSDILFNGFDFKNINGLTLRHVEVENVESGPGLRCENITDLEIDGFKAKGLAEGDPAKNSFPGSGVQDLQPRTIEGGGSHNPAGSWRSGHPGQPAGPLPSLSLKKNRQGKRWIWQSDPAPGKPGGTKPGGPAAGHLPRVGRVRSCQTAITNRAAGKREWLQIGG